MKTIGFIGGGRITAIFLKAFENSGITFEKVIVSDINTDVLDSLKAKFPYITAGNTEQVASSELVFLAVHPPVLLETATAIQDYLKPQTVVVSLAPKHTIARISEAMGGFTNIARMNPSASSIVNKGVNPIAFAPGMDEQAKNELLGLMQVLGSTPEVDESKMEAYAVVSAMGHTYFFFQLQKLTELATSFGLEENEAKNVISEMLCGTMDTLYKSGLTYAEVADLVPVKPMGEVEETIKGYYDLYLPGIYNKIKP